MRLVLIFPILAAIAVATGFAARVDTKAVDVPALKAWAAKEFSDWSYGSKASEKQIDCVQFLVAAIEHLRGEQLPATTRKGVLIALPEEQLAKLAELVEAGEPSIRGVGSALPEAGMGRVISLAEAQPGDFVQFWMKRASGKWEGHAALIEAIEQVPVEGGPPVRGARLFGSHKSTGGIGTADDPLRLIEGKNRRIYIARLTP